MSKKRPPEPPATRVTILDRHGEKTEVDGDGAVVRFNLGVDGSAILCEIRLDGDRPMLLIQSVRPFQPLSLRLTSATEFVLRVETK